MRFLWLAAAWLCWAQSDEPVPPSLDGRLLFADPSTVAAPLDFSGLAGMRMPLLSQRAFSWTDVHYTLDGQNVSDPYQPGRTLVFPDMDVVKETAVRQGWEIGVSPAYGSEISLTLRPPERVWHGELSSAGIGSFLASANSPHAEQFHWFNRDHALLTGPLGPRADMLLSGSGQWASQSAPQMGAGGDFDSHVLLGTAWFRYRLTKQNQLDAQFSGSRIDLSNWGVPAGLEALAGWRMMPPFTGLDGFAGLREGDNLDHVQLSWSRPRLEAHYGFTTAHLDTWPSAAPAAPSQIDLATGNVTGAPPLANFAVRTRQSLRGAFEPGERKSGPLRHNIAVGGAWELARIRNRFTAPFNSETILVNGAPAYSLALNTPTDSREDFQEVTLYARDRITISPWMTVDVAVAGDLTYVWNNASPRAGFALSPPMFRRLTLRGNYARLLSPVAGRYLDYDHTSSLGGVEYQGSQIIGRFGGPYSRIDPNLRRPYADEFNLGAEAALPLAGSASIRLFRRDEKDRIAVENLGVPPSAFEPIQILDPGPDSIPGTFDDQLLTVYAQNPATLGKDRYVLTNPPGLRMLYEGVIAEAGARWRSIQAHASFLAVKSWGPTNPGDSPLENDPGVIGALFEDPNTAVHAAGRSYFDRAYVGKAQLVARLPSKLGGIECANAAFYMDGLPFARQLLITGLPQGPFFVATTLRGSPQGGNRAEYVLNWNLRLSRTFPAPHGNVRLMLDIFNVTNAGNRIEENDISGPLFNQRLPVKIEPPRFLQFGVEYRF